MCTKGDVFLACCKSATPVSCWPHAQTTMSVLSCATTSDGKVHMVTESIVRIHYWSGTNCQDLYMYCPRTDLVANTALMHVTRTCHLCHHVASLSSGGHMQKKFPFLSLCWVHAWENVLSVPELGACTGEQTMCCKVCKTATQLLATCMGTVVLARMTDTIV